MDDSLGNNLLANGVLAGVYIVYKVVDRCLHSRCKYTKLDGLTFDLDGEDGDVPCPAVEMDKIAELLKSRANLHRSNTQRV